MIRHMARCPQLCHYSRRVVIISGPMTRFDCAGLSLAASGRISSLRCVEISKAGERAFWRSAGRLPKPHIPLEYHVASAGANPAAWLAGIDVAVLDPPRKGLDAALLAHLCGSSITDGSRQNDANAVAGPASMHQADSSGRHGTESAGQQGIENGVVANGGLQRKASRRALRHKKKHQAQKQGLQNSPKDTPLKTSVLTKSDVLPVSLQQLVYMSCGWTSFVRDSNALTGSGHWQLMSAKAFVFFPGTDSLETLAMFKRKRHQDT